jgi:16S rRNA processing protein RimM
MTWIRLGVVGRPHGVRGAMRFHLDNSQSTALREGVVVRLVAAQEGGPSSHRVASFSRGILTLDGVADRNGAEGFVHATVEVQRAQLGDDVLLIDLVGRGVVDASGRNLGRVSGFHDNGAQPLGQVQTPDGRSVLVPFVPPLVVSWGDPLVLAPPRGLFDDDNIVVEQTDEDRHGNEGDGSVTHDDERDPGPPA